MKVRLLILLLAQIFTLSAAQREFKQGAFEILQPTERKPARTAVLIMRARTPFLDKYSYCRWQLGEKVWEQYMNAHPNVDCYFLKDTPLKKGSEQAWIEGNTIYVNDDAYEDSGILNRTIATLEKILPNSYTHFFRTNVNAFVNLNTLNEYAETHHQSMYTGPLWQQPAWHLLVYGLLFSADVAAHIVNEFKRLEGSYIVCRHVAEDLALHSLATGVFPCYDYIRQNNLQSGYKKENLEFTYCPALPCAVRQVMCGSSFSTTRLSLYGVQLAPAPSFEEAIDFCNRGMSTAILYRIRGGLDVDKLAELYEHLLKNIYPELPKFDLVEYAKSLPVIRDDKS